MRTALRLRAIVSILRPAPTFRTRPFAGTRLGMGRKGACTFSSANALFARTQISLTSFHAIPRLNAIDLISDNRKVHELVGHCFDKIVNASADFAQGYVETALRQPTLPAGSHTKIFSARS